MRWVCNAFEIFANVDGTTATKTLGGAVKTRTAGNHAAIAATYRGRNNELNAGAYAIINGAVGKQIGPLDYTVGVTNLTNANAGAFTKIGAGVPYPGVAGPLATNRYALEPAAVSFTISLRR